MELVSLDSTKKTPEVLLDPDGKIRIGGRSIPEDASKFYEFILNWVLEYLNNPRDTTTVDIELEYFNSGSAKYVMQILRELSELVSDGRKLNTATLDKTASTPDDVPDVDVETMCKQADTWVDEGQVSTTRPPCAVNARTIASTRSAPS